METDTPIKCGTCKRQMNDVNVTDIVKTTYSTLRLWLLRNLPAKVD